MTYTTVTSLSRKADRLRFLEDLRRAVAAVPDAVLEENETDGDSLRFRAIVPDALGVSAMWLRSFDERAPILSWHGAKARLRGVEGSWLYSDVNPYHGCKATSFPRDLNSLLHMLVNGLRAVADGSAFETPPDA